MLGDTVVFTFFVTFGVDSVDDFHYGACVLNWRVNPMNGSDAKILIEGLDLLAAQKARFAKSQPEFRPIADRLAADYARIRAVLMTGVSNEAPTGSKK